MENYWNQRVLLHPGLPKASALNADSETNVYNVDIYPGKINSNTNVTCLNGSNKFYNGG